MSDSPGHLEVDCASRGGRCKTEVGGEQILALARRIDAAIQKAIRDHAIETRGEVIDRPDLSMEQPPGPRPKA